MSESSLLQLRGVDIAVADKVICHNINLDINEGEVHILVGPNGSGKSTLLCAIMGIKPFEICSGTVTFNGQDIKELEVDQRAQAGIGLGFQRPPTIDGVTVKTLAQAVKAGSRFDDAISALGLTHLVERDVNSGFSGGETKRWEVAKLLIQDPTLCLFDESESGVDLEQVQVVADAINTLMASPTAAGQQRAALVITHTGFILDGVAATKAHLMVDGSIIDSDDPHTMFERIKRGGYVRT